MITPVISFFTPKKSGLTIGCGAAICIMVGIVMEENYNDDDGGQRPFVMMIMIRPVW